MPVRFQHDQIDHSIYFVTFTCFKWIHLIELADAWKFIYKWFDVLFNDGVRVLGYVIMPNHLHVLLYLPCMPKSLNSVVSNGKRFMAYGIIAGLEKKNNSALLEELHGYLTKRELKKGQLHKVFESSFDAKECRSRYFIQQKLGYIHKNPVSKKWQLVRDFADYPHSSAGFYEKGVACYDKILHVAEVW